MTILLKLAFVPVVILAIAVAAKGAMDIVYLVVWATEHGGI